VFGVKLGTADDLKGITADQIAELSPVMLAAKRANIALRACTFVQARGIYVHHTLQKKSST
jgi:hypothetical protein